MINKSLVNVKWNQEKKEWLLDYYKNHSRKETIQEFYNVYGEIISENSIKHIVRTTKDYDGKHLNYTDEQKEWLKENHERYSSQELTNKFNEKFNKNVTRTAIRSLMIRCNLFKKKKWQKWKKEELDLIREVYAQTSALKAAQIISEKTNRVVTEQALSCIAHKHKIPHLREDMYTQEQEQFLIDNYEKYSCKDLTIEFNKEFGTKKGARAIGSKIALLGLHTKCVPIKIGEVTTWGDRPMIKVSESEFMPYANYLWEKHYNKKVPDNYIVTFKDNNNTNFDINNLACVSKKTMSMLNFNKLRDKGEITETAIMLGELMDLNDKGRDENECAK